MPPEPSHTPEPAHEEPTGELPEETAPEKAQLPTLGEFLRERIGNPPDNSGTPRDAIGRNEEEYLTAAAAFLRELLARYAEKPLPLTTPIIPQMGRTSNHLPLQKGNMSSSSRKIPIPA